MRTRIYCSIIAAALPLALASGPASAQFVNNYRAVERYNAVAKGSNIAEWHKRLFDDDVKKRLEAQGIRIAFPRREVHVRSEAPLPASGEGASKNKA